MFTRDDDLNIPQGRGLSIPFNFRIQLESFTIYF